MMDGRARTRVRNPAHDGVSLGRASLGLLAVVLAAGLCLGCSSEDDGNKRQPKPGSEAKRDPQRARSGDERQPRAGAGKRSWNVGEGEPTPVLGSGADDLGCNPPGVPANQRGGQRGGAKERR